MSHPTMPATRSAQRSSPQEEPLTRGAIALLAAPPTFVAMWALVTPHPLAVLQSAILLTLPIAIWAFLIRRYLPDPCVSRSFLVKQFFLGAVPVWLVRTIFNGLTIGDSDYFMVLNDIFDGTLTPLQEWKRFLLPFMAFPSAALDEAAKYFLARRYLRLVLERPVGREGEGASSGHVGAFNPGVRSRPRQASIGCRGVLACACTGALGFASTAYIVVMEPFSMSGTEFLVRNVRGPIVHCLVLLPFALGTTFHIALAMAQRTVLGDSVSVMRAFAVSVFLGGFPLFSLTMHDALVRAGLSHSPLPQGAPDVHVISSICGLWWVMIFVRKSRYRTTLEREYMLVRRSPILSLPADEKRS